MRPHTFLIVLLFFAISCVQIPQESVELSKAMGEDLKEIQRSHIALVNVHYLDLEQNINDFVDHVYAPFQIGKLIEADINDMNRGEEETLSGAIAAAPGSPDAAIKALEYMQFFVEAVRDDIEAYRRDLLQPVQQQRNEILTQLQISYGNVIAANASITAHLSSIRKVKEAQNELMRQMGIEKDINMEMGKKIADLSTKINGVIVEANKIDHKSDDALLKFNEIKDKIHNLTN